MSDDAPRMVKRTMDHLNFTHRTLWRVVMAAIERAATNPVGSFYEHLVAMVFAFHALEAYLNFLGERLAPIIWSDERAYFQREPYRGFMGKVRKVYELCELPMPSITEGPFSGVVRLKELRDLVAHGKVEQRGPFTTVVTADTPMPWPSPVMHDRVSPEEAAQTCEDVQAVALALHTAARPVLEKARLERPDVLLGFGDDPFRGLLGTGTFGETLIEQQSFPRQA